MGRIRHQERFGGTMRAIGIAAIFAGMIGWPVFAAANDSPRLVVGDCRVKLIHEAILACERSGIVTALTVQEGDVVRAGQRIVQLKDEVLRAQWATLVHQSESPDSRAKLQDAQLAEEFAVGRYQIAVAARERNPDAVSRAEILELRIAAERAATAIQQMTLELDLLKLKKQELEAEIRSYGVTAPFAGTITRVMKHPGEAVQLGDPVVELVDASRLKVEGYVSVSEARTLKLGQAVSVVEEVEGISPVPEVRLLGKLVFVDIGIEPVSQRVRIWADVDNSKFLLRPGMLARMELVIGDTAKSAPKR